jgi:hypothetical protein
MNPSQALARMKWNGPGDYIVKQNSIIKSTGATPSVHKNDQSVIIRHREFIGPVVGSSAYTVQYSLTLNPGMLMTFPWLSTVAAGFLEYKIKGMVFQYVPTSGSATGTNTALGSVMFQTTYRANDLPPSSKLELLNEYWANETVPSEAMVHPIECSPAENPFSIHYVRSGVIPSGDILMYDYGTTYIATAGNQGTNQLGDVWVTYEIELKKPVLYSNTSAIVDYYACRFAPATSYSSFFNTPVATSIGALPISFSGRTVTLPIGSMGTYIFQLYAVFDAYSGNVVWQGPPEACANCVETSIDGTNNTWTNNATNSPISTNAHYSTAVRVYDSSAIATFNIPTLPNTTFYNLKMSIAVNRINKW